MIISYNYGHHHPDLGSGIFGFSAIYTCKTFRQFADELRKPDVVKGVMKYSEEKYVPRSSMTILLNINNDHKFMIQLKNVREYRQAIEDYIADKFENKEKYWTE